MISIIHPSRARPKTAEIVAQKWIDRAGCKVEYILSIDFNDPQKAEYFTHRHSGQIRFITLVQNNRSAVDAINKGACEAKGDVLIVISDDFDCPENWGKKILEITSGRKDWIMKTWDGIQDWVITLPIMDRDYYHRFLYIYHPSYLHGWCDTEMTCVAELTNRLIKINPHDLQFLHDHYSVGGLALDETYRRSDAHFEQGRQIFQQRMNRNFFLSETPGKMTDNVYSRMKTE